MVTPNVFVCKVHVKKFRHVNCTEESIEKVLLVENFMGDCKLNWLQIRKDKDHSHKIENIEWSKLIVYKNVHHFEEKYPIDDCSKIKNKLEPNVIVFKSYSLILCGISPIHADQLVQQRKYRVNDNNEYEGMMVQSKIAGNSNQSEKIVGKACHEEFVRSINLKFLAG